MTYARGRPDGTAGDDTGTTAGHDTEPTGGGEEPVHDPPSAENGRHRSRSVRDRGEELRVLCVDDDPDILAVTAARLERASDRIVTTTTTSPEAALDLLDHGVIDCVLSDYQMDPIDGIEFLDHVRAAHGDLPFILFTAQGSEELASEAITEGVTEYFQKETHSTPDTYALLASRIERTVAEYRTNAALAESERMLSTLVSNVPGMVYRCRNDRHWTMEFVSEGCEALTGYPPAVLESGEVTFGADLIHPDDREWLWESVQRHLAMHEPYEFTYRIQTSDGPLRWVYEQGRGVYENGQLKALEGVITDVTELKVRERELERQNDRLERFASVVSHDLRNPLVVAQGSLALARESGDPTDFDRLANALDRMDALIDDLLSLARKGQRVEETESVRVAEVATAAWETVPCGAATLNLALDDYAVEADEGRLRQMLENLFRNSVEHAGQGVTVRVGTLEDGRGFYVADDGVGLPPGDPEALFDYGHSTSDEGTGFGLAIVRSIAEAHDWTVTAGEGDDGGARFEVRVYPSTPLSMARDDPQ